MSKENAWDIVKRFCTDSSNKSWIALSFCCTFMLCFFAPLEAYFANQEEFWFSLMQILPVILGVFILSFIIFSIIFMLVKKLKSAVWIYGFLFYLMLYLYIQGNYVPRNYGVLNGKDIQWDDYPAYGIVSLVLLLVVCVCWIMTSLKIKEKIYGIGRTLCTILVLIQMVTLITLTIQNGAGNQETTVVTTKDMLNLSENRNIIVFILDMFDSADMQDLLEADNDNKCEEILENFTYYPDALGGYPNTMAALPYILTGVRYESGERYRDWVDNGYQESSIYTNLEQNGYSVGLYTEPKFVNADYAENVEYAEYTISSYSDFLKTMYKLVGFNYMPHQLKKYFHTDSSEFSKLKSSKAYDVYSFETTRFYQSMKEGGLTFSGENNDFKVYHIDGTHPPYTFDSTLTVDKDRAYDVYDEAEGCLKLLDEYIQILKDNQVYDNTAIIIMADHGCHGLWQNPVFMIKNFNEKKSFTVSDAKMSWDYLDDIFVSLASGEQVNEAYIQERAEQDGVRRFSHYTWDNNEWDRQYMPEITDYLVYGEAEDISKFECIGEFPYQLGDTLSFGESKTAKANCVYGIGEGEKSGSWTGERYAIMQFDWADDYENILLDLEWGTVSAPPQTIIVYANQHKVMEFEAESAGNQEIIIPHQLADEGRLTLGFEFPDSISPKDRGTGNDIRKLSLYLKSITLSSIGEASSYDYDLGEVLSFCGEGASANRYCVNGFSGNEENFTWTMGNEAEMEFKVDDEGSDLLLDFSYLTYAEAQHVKVYVNDNEVEDYIAREAESKQIRIPNEYVEDGRIVLRFEMPDATSPRENGTGEDVRVLALALNSLSISSVK